jgi:hypothetical protein
MKLFVIVVAVFSMCSLSAFGRDFHLADVKLKNLQFVAPVVPDADAITNAQVGTIVYDATSNQYRGLNSAGDWDAMTVPGVSQVTSGGTSEKIERVTVVTSGAGTCATSNSSSSWIVGAVRISSGRCSLNISGAFSSTPTCVVSAIEGANTATDGYWGRVMNASATLLEVVSYYQNGLTTFSMSDNVALNVICMGPR